MKIGIIQYQLNHIWWSILRVFQEISALKVPSLNMFFLNQHIKSLYSNVEELQATTDQTVKTM